jgi:hypothetical protein
MPVLVCSKKFNIGCADYENEWLTVEKIRGAETQIKEHGGPVDIATVQDDPKQKRNRMPVLVCSKKFNIGCADDGNEWLTRRNPIKENGGPVDIATIQDDPKQKRMMLAHQENVQKS